MPAQSPQPPVLFNPSLATPGRSASWARRLSVISVAVLLVACGKAEAPAAAAPDGGMPAPEVGVVTVAPGDVGLQTELPGRLEASRVAQVRARAAGILQQRLFREGSDVKAGQALFRIDAAPYQATLQSARAGQARAEANLAQASALAARYKPLVAENAISQQEFANAEAAQKAAEADVAVARAAVQTAGINLGYANVTAPIGGRIGRALVTEGALVGQNETTPLALIQQLDPIHADLTQSTRELNDLRRAFRSGQLKEVGQGQAKATLIQDDGSLYPLPGKLLFAEISVDPGTGQIILRSEFPNPDLDLLPGSFVRVRLEQAVDKQGISVPQRAITRDSAGIPMVLLLDAEQTVSQQPVELGAVINDRWVVSHGLKPGDRIVVEGLQHAVELPQILKGGARVLYISNEHPEALERLAPSPDEEVKVRSAMRLLREARAMREVADTIRAKIGRPVAEEQLKRFPIALWYARSRYAASARNGRAEVIYWGHCPGCATGSATGSAGEFATEFPQMSTDSPTT